MGRENPWHLLARDGGGACCPHVKHVQQTRLLVGDQPLVGLRLVDGQRRDGVMCCVDRHPPVGVTPTLATVHTTHMTVTRRQHEAVVGRV